MTLKQYNNLSFLEQFNVIYHFTKVATLHEGENDRHLYQEDDFYLEVYFEHKTGFYFQFKIITDINLLNPYLDQISLKGII